MEEILSSIRRIISEDGEPAAEAAGAAEAPKGTQAKPTLVPKEGASPPPGPNVKASPPPRAAAPTAKGEPVLDLTDMVQADGTVVNLNQRAAPAKMKANEAPMADPMPMPMPTSAAMTRPRAAEPMAPSMQAGRDEGLVSRDTAMATTEAFANFAGAVSNAKGVPIGDGSQTLQDVVVELLRPMLRDWLDRNLQPIVARAVERELTKLAGHAEDQ